jgi:hypothetical protein
MIVLLARLAAASERNPVLRAEVLVDYGSGDIAGEPFWRVNSIQPGPVPRQPRLPVPRCAS